MKMHDNENPRPLLTDAGRRLTRSRRGMSLIEVMVVIAIILTLMSLVAVGVFTLFGQAQADMTGIMIGKANQMVEVYQLRKRKVPSSLDEVYATDPNGIPKDSWDNELILVVPGPGNAKWDIISYGADGAEGGTGENADIKLSEL